MTIIVDTSILIAVLLNEPQKAKIIEETKGSQLFAPQSLHWEIGNAFSSMLMRKRITLAEVLKAVKSYKSIDITFLDIDLEGVLDICNKFNIYAYDAFFLICSVRYGYPFMSLDKKLIEIAGKLKINIIEA